MSSEVTFLGKTHSVIKGDATDWEDVINAISGQKVALALLDPPYGKKIRCSRKRQRKDCGASLISERILGDKDTSVARENYEIVSSMVSKLIIWGGQYFSDFLPPNGGWLIWNKRHSLPNYAQAELAWTNIKINTRVYNFLWSGQCREGSKKYNPRPCIHPTQKPVELFCKIIEDFTYPNDIILDCFGGSGTTLIACELTGRRAIIMENDIKYYNAILERYRNHIDTFTPIFR